MMITTSLLLTILFNDNKNITNEIYQSVIDIGARDFIESILKDVESGVIEYVEKRFLR